MTSITAAPIGVYEACMELTEPLEAAVVAVAQEIGCSPAQVAIRWVQQRPYGGAPIIPVLGARSQAHILDNLGALDINLTPEHIARLDQIGKLQLGFPHDFLSSEGVRGLVFGETFGLIDNHHTPKKGV